MNGILFAPGPGSARGWAGRGARPEPPAGPARGRAGPEVFSLCVSACLSGLAPEAITELQRTSKRFLFYNVFGHLAKVEIPMRLRLASPRNFHVRFALWRKVGANHLRHAVRER